MPLLKHKISVSAKKLERSFFCSGRNPGLAEETVPRQKRPPDMARPSASQRSSCPDSINEKRLQNELKILGEQLHFAEL